MFDDHGTEQRVPFEEVDGYRGRGFVSGDDANPWSPRPATRLIVSGGLAAVTLRDVGDAGGYGTKVVTRYFANERLVT